MIRAGGNRRARLVGALAVVAALLAACGVPVDSQPEVLSTTAVPYNLLVSPTPTVSASTATATPSSTPSTAPAHTGGQVAFLVDEDHIELLDRRVAAGTPIQVIQTLLGQLRAGPSEAEHISGLGSAIPTGAGLTATSIVGDLVMIDLTSDTWPAADRLRVAVAQIVLTATSQPGVTRVVLSRDGLPVDAPLANGTLTSKPVTHRDYERLIRG